MSATFWKRRSLNKCPAPFCNSEALYLHQHPATFRTTVYRATALRPSPPGHPGPRHPMPGAPAHLGLSLIAVIVAHPLAGGCGRRPNQSDPTGGLRLRSFCGPFSLPLRSICGLQTNEQSRARANTVPRGPASAGVFACVRWPSRSLINRGVSAGRSGIRRRRGAPRRRGRQLRG